MRSRLRSVAAPQATRVGIARAEEQSAGRRAEARRVRAGGAGIDIAHRRGAGFGATPPPQLASMLGVAGRKEHAVDGADDPAGLQLREPGQRIVVLAADTPELDERATGLLRVEEQPITDCPE